MEIDRSTAMHPGSGDSTTSDVQEEIEQRWHQVETTPLREEKQVPINTGLGISANSDRLSAHELAAQLDKEVFFIKCSTMSLWYLRDLLYSLFLVFLPLCSWDRSKWSWTNYKSKTTF